MSPQGPRPAEAARSLGDFLRRNPARHRAVAAVALALVAGATIGRPCDPLRLHALVVASFITTALVLSDLFVQQDPTAAGKAHGLREACLDDAGPAPLVTDHALASCPACGLPVFARRDDAPRQVLGIAWHQGPGARLALAPFVSEQVHANDDVALDFMPACEAGLWSALVPGPALGADAAEAVPEKHSDAAALPSASVPEMVGRTRLSPRKAPRATYAGSRLKTALDMIGAALLLIALAPLMLAIACLLLASGGRPVLVHHDRLDWSGGCFRVSRFRSGPSGWAVPGDAAGEPEPGCAKPRMKAKIESFLHRSGLASLPLLVSILRGDLSFVGLDPAMPKMSRRDRAGAAIVAEFASRSGARPGLTGWAEVSTGAAQGRTITARQKIACDLYYLEHGSPLLDLRILARTLDALASGDRA